MPPNKRKPLLKSLLSAHLGCGGCGATQPNYTNVYQPKPRPKPKSTSSSSNGEGEASTTSSTATAHSDEPGPSWPINNMVTNTPTTILSPNINPTSKVRESIAVVKESKDPYEDFRHSMLQMIFENQITSTEELHHLLQCFLRLNSPAHHHFILRAFFQVCDIVVSSPSKDNLYVQLI